MTTNQAVIANEQRWCANNYHPLPVALCRGEGCYVWDVEGRRYLDMMSAYSAVSHGHCHPRLVNALTEQARKLTITSRAFHTDNLAAFLQRICDITHFEKALPMNTGAEAVETALKAARKWGYQVKGIAKDKAEIIVCNNNFHGRTITIISMSTEPQYREGFGPLTPGFRTIPFGDAAALADAITENTAAFLVEPLQGEAGMILPPPGFLSEAAAICRQHNVLLICDEIQSGLGRSGKFLASDHENVKPDGLILGKSLGGGMVPVSLFLANANVMDVFTPGDHGSTFGGNPLAAAVGLEALNVLFDEKLIERSQQLGEHFLEKLRALAHPAIAEVRGLGLFIGMEINPGVATARQVVEGLLAEGVLSKDTHETVVRLAPPFVITEAEIDICVTALHRVLENCTK